LAENGIVLNSDTTFHDSQHGTTNTKTIDIAAPGAIKITIGDCNYGAASVQLLNEEGTEIDSAELKTGCYSASATEGSGLVVLKYTGSDAANLQVKFSGGTYLPYLSIESIEPTENTTPETPGTSDGEDETTNEKSVYAVSESTSVDADGVLYEDSNVKVTSIFAASAGACSYTTDFGNGYSIVLRLKAEIKANVADVSSSALTDTLLNSSNQTGFVIEPTVSGTLTTYVGAAAGSRTVQLWDNTTNTAQKDSVTVPDGGDVIVSTFTVEAGHQYILYAKGFTGNFIGFELEPTAAE
jgi:hypothetical protein